MTDKDINRIAEEMANKDSEELIKIVFIEPGNYIKEVSDSAKKELVKRGINRDSDIVIPYLKELELNQLKESRKIVWFDEAYEFSGGSLKLIEGIGKTLGYHFIPFEIVLYLFIVFVFLKISYEHTTNIGFDWFNLLVLPLICVIGFLYLLRRSYRIMTRNRTREETKDLDNRINELESEIYRLKEN